MVSYGLGCLYEGGDGLERGRWCPPPASHSLHSRGSECPISACQRPDSAGCKVFMHTEKQFPLSASTANCKGRPLSAMTSQRLSLSGVSSPSVKALATYAPSLWTILPAGALHLAPVAGMLQECYWSCYWGKGAWYPPIKTTQGASMGHLGSYATIFPVG